jgi:hypothetical protein
MPLCVARLRGPRDYTVGHHGIWRLDRLFCRSRQMATVQPVYKLACISQYGHRNPVVATNLPPWSRLSSSIRHSTMDIQSLLSPTIDPKCRVTKSDSPYGALKARVRYQRGDTPPETTADQAESNPRPHARTRIVGKRVIGGRCEYLVQSWVDEGDFYDLMEALKAYQRRSARHRD